VSTTFSGAGAVALGHVFSPVTAVSGSDTSPGSGKKLLATTDYFDNIIWSKFLFQRKHLDSLNKYLASIGVTRHQWMVEHIWSFYDKQPVGFDLLAEAVKSAHAYGVELYAELKRSKGEVSGAHIRIHCHSLKGHVHSGIYAGFILHHARS